MSKIFKITVCFQFLNILLLVILENVYDWQGQYFMLGLISNVPPNILALVLNLISVSLTTKYFYKGVKNFYFYFFPYFYLTNELSFTIFKQEPILFGFLVKNSPNIITVDKTYFIFISLTPFLAFSILYILKSFQTPRTIK